MRKRHKKSKEIKAICLAKGEKIPDGYTVKGTTKFFKQEMLVAVPDQILNQPELVDKVVNQVNFKMSVFWGA